MSELCINADKGKEDEQRNADWDTFSPSTEIAFSFDSIACMQFDECPPDLLSPGDLNEGMPAKSHIADIYFASELLRNVTQASWLSIGRVQQTGQDAASNALSQDGVRGCSIASARTASPTKVAAQPREGTEQDVRLRSQELQARLETLLHSAREGEVVDERCCLLFTDAAHLALSQCNLGLDQ